MVRSTLCLIYECKLLYLYAYYMCYPKYRIFQVSSFLKPKQSLLFKCFYQMAVRILSPIYYSIFMNILNLQKTWCPAYINSIFKP